MTIMRDLLIACFINNSYFTLRILSSSPSHSNIEYEHDDNSECHDNMFNYLMYTTIVMRALV